MCFLPNPYKKTFWRVVVLHIFLHRGRLLRNTIMRRVRAPIFRCYYGIQQQECCFCSRVCSRQEFFPIHVYATAHWRPWKLALLQLKRCAGALLLLSAVMRHKSTYYLLTDFQPNVNPICQLLILCYCMYYVVSHTRNEIISIKLELHNQGLSQLFFSVSWDFRTA